MRFCHIKIEEASPLQRRALEGVLRILDGHNTNFVGTITVNLMLEVIMAEVPDGSLNLMDSYIDTYSIALKRGVRARIAAKRDVQE